MRGTDKVHILAAFAVMRRKWFHFWRKCCDDYGWGFKLLFGGNVIMYSKGCGEILRKAWRTWKGGGCLIASSWQTCHKQQQTAREEIKTLEMSCKKMERTCSILMLFTTWFTFEMQYACVDLHDMMFVWNACPSWVISPCGAYHSIVLVGFSWHVFFLTEAWRFCANTDCFFWIVHKFLIFDSGPNSS